MKKIFRILLCCSAAAALLLGCNSNKAAKKAQLEQELAALLAAKDSAAAAEAAAREETVKEKMATLPEEPIFAIITNMGTIKVKLFKDTPKHRDNFAKLALGGYYDSLLFHRVINGFMIQGGDPYTRDTSAAAVAKYGQGGPDYTIPAEFVAAHTHRKGALAAARRGDAANPYKESSGSQFYLVQDEAACARLDGNYTVYGQTVSGLDVIDRIAQVATDRRERPIKDVRIKTIQLEEE